MAEWAGKQVLSAIGVAVPQGGLATTVEEAVTIAEGIGYPVVMKAQAASLMHKSEVGGVLLSLGDARSEEHTSELPSLMRISYAVFCLKNKNTHVQKTTND